MARRTTTPAPRRSPEQWRELVDRQRRSGLNIAAFSREEGLVYQTFVRWCRKSPPMPAAERAVSSAPTPSPSTIAGTTPSALPEFIEIGVAEPVVHAVEPWLVELDLGDGMTLRVRRSLSR